MKKKKGKKKNLEKTMTREDFNDDGTLDDSTMNNFDLDL
jgi:hypothetical protein